MSDEGMLLKVRSIEKKKIRTFSFTQHHHTGIRSIDENTYDKNKIEEQEDDDEEDDDEEDDVAIDDFRLDAR